MVAGACWRLRVDVGLARGMVEGDESSESEEATVRGVAGRLEGPEDEVPFS